jgi:hypothetical protein
MAPRRSPVVLVPGFTGSRLATRGQDGAGIDLWLDPASMSDSPAEVPITPSAWWIDQMSLAGDGVTPKCDPDANGPVAGLAAISVLDPRPGHAETSRYFWSLIEALHEAGYTDETLVAAPYDWRSAPAGLESRSGYFTRLRTTIEGLVSADPTATPVTVIGHSLGNRMLQHFFAWIVASEGSPEWLDRHLARYVAVSALWLGVPKSIREALTGAEGFGLTQISGLRGVYQSYGALPWMIPVTPDLFHYFNTEHFAFLGDDAHPLEIEAALASGAASTLRFFEEFYAGDPLYTSPGGATGDLATRRPPVRRIDVLHAVGQDTEVGAYYRRSDDGLITDTSASSSDPAVVVRNGIRYETSEQTIQAIDGTRNSGDGFLPYGSLRYFTRWEGDGIASREFAGRTHYDVLADQAFLDHVIALVEDVSDLC